MAKKFGNTWWGKQWLNSLSHIDYSNRLPRGARYARNGSVKKIEIKKGDITASVQGSMPRPYKVTISVPQFSQSSIKTFLDKLTDNPMIVASLMHHRLDPEVLQIAKEAGLQVFPKAWTDFKMRCSCPDWAVPCKHLAAVIYKLGEEIDNDPFLVFSLHGLDLAKELERRGIASNVRKILNPPSIAETMSTTDEIPSERKWEPKQVDLTAIPKIGGELLRLLPDNPSFSESSNFKDLYSKTLSSISKKAAKLAAESYAEEELGLSPFAEDSDISFRINRQYNTEAETHSPTLGDVKFKIPEFETNLAAVSPSDYGKSQPWIESMHRMWLLAVDLVAKGNIVPKIVTEGKRYSILWFSADIQEDVRNAVDIMASGIPEGIVSHGDERVKDSARWLLSCLIGNLVCRLAPKSNCDEVADMFFRGASVRFDGVGQTSTPGGIQAWTERLHISTSAIRPLLKVDESDNGFEVNVDFEGVFGTMGRMTLSLGEMMSGREYAPYVIKGVGILSSMAEYVPQLSAYVKERGKKPMTFSTKEFPAFLFDIMPLISLMGVKTVLPKSLRNLIRPKVSMSISAPGGADSASRLHLDSLLEFKWDVALGDTHVSAEEFRRMMTSAGELVKFKGSYIYADSAELAKIQAELAKEGKLKPHEVLRIALSEEYEGASVCMTDEAKEIIRRIREIEPIPAPDGLCADLRPYQQRGYEWMLHNMKIGFGSIIADDMGLGKTLQVIATVLKMKEEGELDKKKALVVVPTGLLTNWVAEINRFAPGLKVHVYHGSQRSLERFKSDILLTSYGVMRSDSAKIKKLKWAVMAIDEAQNIKNPSTAQTKAVCSIGADHRIAMSGTPVENRLQEYWSIMNFANKGYLGTINSFGKTFARPIQMEGNEDAARRFRAVTSPFMMRRLKSDRSIISDLPDKIERDEFATLSPEQATLYTQTLQEAMRQIEGEKGSDHASLFKRQGLVLQMILALKQICDHPALFLKNGELTPELSGKVMMLTDMVRGIVDSGEKVLIFTQFKEMGEILVQTLLQELGRRPLFYHGGCSVSQRAEMVDRFQNLRSDQVFVLSLKAAGTGLNLTAASNVIHFDLWWNPAVEAQATDRAYRIGQHRNVQVHRFITKGTFEEKINDMIQDKKRLADMTVKTGEKWIGQLSDKELRDLFTL